MTDELVPEAQPAAGDAVPTPPAMQRRLDAEADPVLRQLVAATPAQIESWMTSNVTSLAQSRRVLLALALAVRHLYQKA